MHDRCWCSGSKEYKEERNLYRSSSYRVTQGEEKLRILILANNDVGLYKFRKELIEELLKKNIVYISLPYGNFVNDLCDMGCKFIDTPMERRGMNPFKDVKLLIAYFKMVRKHKPDLVITYTIKPNVYGGMSCRLLKIPYAMNITGLGTAFEQDGILKALVIKMYHIACKKAKVVFFENEENRQLFIKEHIVDEERTHKLNGAGVNLEEYQVMEYPTEQKIHFLFMGRIMKEKGIEELFEAMRKLIDDGMDCCLDVLGESEEDYKALITQYENEGWLHYYGYQKDVNNFIKQCHCFVLPSWHEGMANTNLECAASGRPVITSDIPGCMEAVIDGKSGFLVKKKATDSLYGMMKKFVNLSYETRKKMGLVGRNYMENKFDKRKVVAETMNCLIEEVV